MALFSSSSRRFFTHNNYILLAELIRAKFLNDDRNSILGLLWSLLGPVAMFLAMYFIFRTRFGQGITHYPLYLLIGIVLVNFFVNAITCGSRSLIHSREMLLNSSVSPEDIIIVELFVHIYKFLIEIIICIVLSVILAKTPLMMLISLVPLLVAYFGLIIGINFFLAILNCFLSDTWYIWILLSRFLFIVTPIFYTLHSISFLAANAVYFLNPLTPFLISFRKILLEQGRIDMGVYLYSLAVGISIFFLGYLFFRRLKYFAIEKT